MNEQYQDLKSLVKQLIEMLDYTEESESGELFNPITINCYRAGMLRRLNKVLEDLKRAVE